MTDKKKPLSLLEIAKQYRDKNYDTSPLTAEQLERLHLERVRVIMERHKEAVAVANATQIELQRKEK